MTELGIGILTSAPDVQNYIILLEVQPLHYLPRELGHEGGGVLVRLSPLLMPVQQRL